jgi:hypothetical protein
MAKASSILSKVSSTLIAGGPIVSSFSGPVGTAFEIGGLLLGLGASIAQEHEASGTSPVPTIRRIVSQWPSVHDADAAVDAEQARIAAGGRQ